MSKTPLFKLKPRQTALTALAHILLTLLDTLQAAETAIITQTHPEALHDFRVAIRRSRVALSQLKGVLGSSEWTQLQADLRWLGKMAGPARDLEVALDQLSRYQAELPATVIKALVPVQAALHQQYHQAYAHLKQHLQQARYHQLIQRWRHWLTVPPTQWPQSHNAQQPIMALANAALWDSYQRLLTEAAALTADSPATQYHQLRKTSKTVRYLLEFFGSLYPLQWQDPLLQSLKALQQQLGDFQDLTVQIAALQHLHQQLPESADTLSAFTAMIAHLSTQETVLRQTFPHWFARFASASNRKLWENLLQRPHSH